MEKIFNEKKFGNSSCLVLVKIGSVLVPQFDGRVLNFTLYITDILFGLRCVLKL